MFEMASGHPPYTGENQMEILHKHLQEPIPRLAQTVLDIPEPVDELVFALLAKSPDDRPESAGEVARKLEDILQPGRRVDPVEPTLFRTRRTVKSLKEPVPATPSSDSIPAMKTVGIRLKPTWNWLLIGCLIFAGLLGWMGKIQSSNLLIAHEKYLIDQLEATDPLARKFAINALSQARDIQPTSVRKIRDVVMKGPDDVAIAAMSVMSNHPRQFRAYQWEIHKLQNHLEASPQLRHQAEATSTLLKSATINPRYWPGIPMIAGLIIAFLVAAIVIGVTLLRAEEPWKTFHLKLSRLLN